MQRKRGELVPIAETLTDLPGPGQARNHFTQADQVDRLVRGPAKRTPTGASWHE